jgi:ATP-dependent RNA helicase DeaD
LNPQKFSKAIPLLLANTTDLVGLAKTGTGKTAAFGLPLLQLIDTSSSSIQALVLVPTRELGQQIFRNLEDFAKPS